MKNKRRFYPRTPDRRKLQEIFLEAALCSELSHETSRKYWSWIKRFVKHFECKVHPSALNDDAVIAFIGSLQGKVSSDSYHQAVSALSFLYREALPRSKKLRLKGMRSVTPATPTLLQTLVQRIFSVLLGI